jgi:hypothetical protein
MRHMSTTKAALLIAMVGRWPVVVQGSLTAHVVGGQAWRRTNATPAGAQVRAGP